MPAIGEDATAAVEEFVKTTREVGMPFLRTTRKVVSDPKHVLQK